MYNTEIFLQQFCGWTGEHVAVKSLNYPLQLLFEHNLWWNKNNWKKLNRKLKYQATKLIENCRAVVKVKIFRSNISASSSILSERQNVKVNCNYFMIISHKLGSNIFQQLNMFSRMKTLNQQQFFPSCAKHELMQIFSINP